MASTLVWGPVARQMWERTFVDDCFHQNLLCSATNFHPDQTIDLAPFLRNLSTFHGCIFNNEDLDKKFQELVYWKGRYDSTDGSRSIQVWFQGEDLSSRPWLEFPLLSRGEWTGQVIAKQTFPKGMCLGPVRPVKVYRRALSDAFGPPCYDKASKILHRIRDGVFACCRDRQGIAHPVLLYNRPDSAKLGSRNLPAHGMGLQFIPSSADRNNVELCEDGMVYTTRDIRSGEALFLPHTEKIVA